jgi:transcriptional regulator GlxA family with amidase domain
MQTRLVVLMFPGAQSLDIFGPAEVFACANRERAERAERAGEACPEAVELVFASSVGGLCEISAGTSIATVALSTLRLRASHTVLVVGGEEGPVINALNDGALCGFLRRAARVCRRLGSVCSGSFLLGAAGLLDGKRCATHWASGERLQRFVPGTVVDKDAIFVRDGSLWTSAGVTTGIDMALAMVDADFGRQIADAVAARLVLYARRPGFQSQFTDTLVAQQDASAPFRAVIAWARRHLRELDVDALAQQAAMSPRTLHRKTVEHLRLTPAKLVEALRVEAARTLLSTTTLAQKDVAFRCGFRDTARMQRALKRSLGVDGNAVRLLFSTRQAT